jgi:hypothetical protein
MNTKMTSLFRKMIVCLGALLLAFSPLHAQQPPDMPKPQKEHAWLEQFVGEWETEASVTMGPGQEPMKMKGTEAGRKLGGFWVVVEGKGDAFGMPFASLLTLGYDTEKKKYVGTWVDSMQNTMWKYEGSLDATGKILTLDTEGPNPMTGKLGKFKDVTEFKSKDERIFTSSIQGDDGKWTTFLTVTCKRKK